MVTRKPTQVSHWGFSAVREQRQSPWVWKSNVKTHDQHSTIYWTSAQRHGREIGVHCVPRMWAMIVSWHGSAVGASMSVCVNTTWAPNALRHVGKWIAASSEGTSLLSGRNFVYPFPSLYVLFMLLWTFHVSICLPLVIYLALWASDWIRFSEILGRSIELLSRRMRMIPGLLVPPTKENLSFIRKWYFYKI